jgi:hypothetical protein
LANLKAPKKKAAKKKPSQPKSRPQKPLPEPVEESRPGPVLVHQEEESGLLSGIGNLFKPKAAEAPTQSAAPSSGSSPDSLTPEAQRLLASVPDSIGADPADPGDAAELPDEDAIAGLMAMVAFEPQDVQDMLCELFDWWSELSWINSPHWKLTDRKARIIGRPTAMLLNSCWSQLQTIIPGLLGRWMESTPGASAALLAWGIVVGPMAAKQIAISRERKKRRPVIAQPIRPEPSVPSPSKPPAGDATGPGFVVTRQ